MRIEYDPEANAPYIRFRDAKPVDNIDIEDGLTVDLDDKNVSWNRDPGREPSPSAGHPRNDHRPEPADR